MAGWGPLWQGVESSAELMSDLDCDLGQLIDKQSSAFYQMDVTDRVLKPLQESSSRLWNAELFSASRMFGRDRRLDEKVVAEAKSR